MWPSHPQFLCRISSSIGFFLALAHSYWFDIWTGQNIFTLSYQGKLFLQHDVMYLVLLVIVQHQTFQDILLVLSFGFRNFNHLMLRSNPYAQDCSESLKPHTSFVVCIIHGNGLICISNSNISWSVITVMIFAILFLIVQSLLNHRVCNPHFYIYGKLEVSGSIPGATRFSEQQWVWNGVHSAS